MLVIAHRGSSQVAPENTLPAIERAIRDGADAIEVDVQLTKDQQVVVIHDEWVNRTTNGSGFIYDMTYKQLQQLDAGAWFSSRFKGTKVPLLEEVLSLVSSHSVELHVELKNNLISYQGLEKLVSELVSQAGLEARVIISSFRRDSLELCQALSPRIRRGYLCWSTLDPLYAFKEWEHLRLYSIHPHVSLIQPQIKYLQQYGYKLFPYVIERKNQLDRCVQYRVDGIFTNSPRKVKELLR